MQRAQRGYSHRVCPAEPAECRKQLHHLTRTVREYDVTVQVVPFTTGAHAALCDQFEIIQFVGERCALFTVDERYVVSPPRSKRRTRRPRPTSAGASRAPGWSLRVAEPS
ncbi:MAG: Scr1 family TA system antitoxin-like transcriptional regulator [Pseudonocardiaceae bacterium]